MLKAFSLLVLTTVLVSLAAPAPKPRPFFVKCNCTQMQQTKLLFIHYLKFENENGARIAKRKSETFPEIYLNAFQFLAGASGGYKTREEAAKAAEELNALTKESDAAYDPEKAPKCIGLSDATELKPVEIKKDCTDEFTKDASVFPVETYDDDNKCLLATFGRYEATFDRDANVSDKGLGTGCEVVSETQSPCFFYTEKPAPKYQPKGYMKPPTPPT